MREVSMIGLDTAKNVFQLHGCTSSGEMIFVKRLRRTGLLPFLAKQPACTVALEACGASNHWARAIIKLGHAVKQVPPVFVKRFLDGDKTDRRDAEALAEAGLSAKLRPVAVKDEVAQAKALNLKVRGLFVRQRTQTGNSLRGHLAEFGLVARAGDRGLEALIERVEAGETGLPAEAMEAIAALVAQWRKLGSEIERLSRDIACAAKADPRLSRLMSMPGVGPMIATAFASKVDDPSRFRSSHACVSWLGLAPKEYSSGDKRKIGHISKAGDEDVRMLLILGAVSVLSKARRFPDKASDPWIGAILARKPFKVAAVALAARMARTLWAMMKSGETYQPRRMSQTNIPAAT